MTAQKNNAALGANQQSAKSDLATLVDLFQTTWPAATTLTPPAHPLVAVFIDGADSPRQALLQQLSDSTHPLYQRAQTDNADFKIFDLGEEPSEKSDLTTVRALAYGLMSIAPGIDAVHVAVPHAPNTFTTGDALQQLLRCRPALLAAAGCLLAARMAKIPATWADDGAGAVADLLRRINPSLIATR